MKKLNALLLATLMLISGVTALAAEYTALDEKLSLQLQNGSGLSATVTFSATPNTKMSWLDAQSNLIVNALLPGSVLELKQITGAGLGNRDKEDLTLTLSRNGKNIADIRHTSDGVLETIASSLLGDKSYVSHRGDGQLFSLLFDWDTTWPGVERAILAMSTADLEWKKQAEAQLKFFSDKLSLWLQGYTRMSNERDKNGQTVIINAISIPMADLKKETKLMLTDLYANKGLMSLLRENMTSAESAAYLEPSLLQGLLNAMDALPLTGAATIERRYDQAGKLLLEEANLPMGGSRGMEHIHYRMVPFDDLQDETLLEVRMVPVDKANTQGSVYTLKLLGGAVEEAEQGNDTKNFTGNLTIQQEPLQDKGFQVLDEAAKDTKSYDFNLFMDNGLSVQDLQTRQYTSQHEISLVIKPQGIPGLGDQSMRLALTMTSGASTNSSTKFNGQLIWKDLLSDSAITADLSGSSIPPWVIPSVDAMSAVRLDRMNAQALQGLKLELQTNLLTGISGLLGTLTTPVLP